MSAGGGGLPWQRPLRRRPIHKSSFDVLAHVIRGCVCLRPSQPPVTSRNVSSTPRPPAPLQPFLCVTPRLLLRIPLLLLYLILVIIIVIKISFISVIIHVVCDARVCQIIRAIQYPHAETRRCDSDGANAGWR